MPKILVSCAAADGHVNPFLPVVSHLINAGHEVVWICGRTYRQKIEATGAKFVPMPLEFDPNGQPIYEFKPELKKLKGIAQIKFYIRTWCYDAVKPTMEIIHDIRKEFKPDLYLSDPIVYAPYLEAEMLNRPCINLHVIPLSLSSKDHGPFGTGISPTASILGKWRIRLLNFLVDNVVFRDLKKEGNAMRAGQGLEPYDHVFNDFLQNTTTVFATTVPGFDYHRSDMPDNIKYIGPIFPKAKPDFVEPKWWPELFDERKVVLVNQGTIANDISELILPTTEALKGEDVLVIAVPVTAEIKDLPNNVKVAEFIPFAHLLPHVDVMVTNGGYGATHMALAHGIPLVCSGGSEDKMEVSARAAYSGCGINLKKLSPSSAEIKKAVHSVLQNSSFKEKAERLKREIQSFHPLDLVAEEIEKLV